MKPALLLFLLFCATNTRAQQHQAAADSLKMRLSQLKEDSTKVIAYSDAILSLMAGTPEEGLALEAPALALAKKLNWQPGIADLSHTLGELYCRLGRFEEAIAYHRKATDTYQKLGDNKGKGIALYDVGQAYLDYGKFDEAEDFLLQSIELNKSTKNYETLISGYDLLSLVYELQGKLSEAISVVYKYLKASEQYGQKRQIAHANYKQGYYFGLIGNTTEAMKYYENALNIAKEVPDDVNIIGYYLSIARLRMQLNLDPDEQYKEALQIARKFGNKRMLGEVFWDMGQYEQQKNNYAAALEYYLRTEETFKAVNETLSMAYLYPDIASMYAALNNYPLSRKYFDAAYQISERTKNSYALKKYFAGKEKFDSTTGNWQSAYFNYKKYTALRDSAESKETLRKMIGTQLQYENEKKEAALKAEQERKDLLAREEIKRQRNIRNASFAVLAAVLVFSVIALYQRNKLAKEKKRSDQLVQDKELLLREIHHRVKNNLEVVSSLLALQSAQIDDAPTKDVMQESQNRVQSIGIVHQKLYQGTNLGSIEMKDYFLNLSESILDSFGAEQRVTIECAMDRLDVDIDTAVPLGLIVNELLTNTLKYAFPEGQPGKVSIKLQRPKEGVLHLEVSDNGVGKSGLTKGTGFGGQLISLLTRQLNGTMTEEVQAGTRIYFEFKTGTAA